MTIFLYGWTCIRGGIKQWDETINTIVILTHRQDDYLLNK